LSCLAWAYYQDKKYLQAEPLYQRVISITEKSLGPHAPALVWYLRRSADNLKMLRRNSEAEALEGRARDIEAEYRKPDEH
jgi:hypothetical protein